MKPAVLERARVRFEARVIRPEGSSCWIWRGATDKDGYGRFSIGERSHIRATHASWLLAHGEYPPRGAFMCHRCDTPACVNPAHLWIGDAKTNAGDRKAKGRNPDKRGEAHHNRKLTREQALSALHDPRPAPAVAAELGVSPFTIYDLRSGRTWAMLRDEAA